MKTKRTKGINWDFGGRQLDYGWALALCSYVGFAHGRGLIRAVAVMTAESERWTRAWNKNANGSIDRGLFQVNSTHDSQLSPSDAFSAIPNARFAWALSEQGGDFTHWAVFNHKPASYRAAIVAATWFYVFGTGWRKRISRVLEELA